MTLPPTYFLSSNTNPTNSAARKSPFSTTLKATLTTRRTSLLSWPYCLFYRWEVSLLRYSKSNANSSQDLFTPYPPSELPGAFEPTVYADRAYRSAEDTHNCLWRHTWGGTLEALGRLSTRVNWFNKSGIIQAVELPLGWPIMLTLVGAVRRSLFTPLCLRGAGCLR
jgi:hypothetical protein